MKKLFILLLVVKGFGINLYAQSTANAPVHAMIITPILVTKNTDLNFGNIAIGGTTGGSVVLTASATATRTPNGVTLPTTIGSVSAAKFTVTGYGGSTYSITWPSGDLTLTRSSGTEIMTVNSWTNSIGSATSTLRTDGSDIFYVGATLNVVAGQAPGTYNNSSGFPVTVNYN